LRSQDTKIWVGLGMQIAKTPTYPVISDFHFLLHYVIRIHNIRPIHRQSRQTDRWTAGWTDVMHACRMSLTYCIACHAKNH